MRNTTQGKPCFHYREWVYSVAGHEQMQMGTDEHRRAQMSTGLAWIGVNWCGLVQIGTDEHWLAWIGVNWCELAPRNYLKSLSFKMQEMRDGNDDMYHATRV